MFRTEMPAFTSTVEPIEHATLTFLTDGKFVLGCPRKCSDMERSVAIEAIKHYLSGENGGAVLPWPVDVYDERGEK